MKASLHRGLFVGFVAMVVAYGNLKARLFGLSPAGSPEGALAGLGVAGLVLVGARLFGLSAEALGIGWSNRLSLRRCVWLGVGCGLVASLGPALAVVTHLVPADRPEGALSWGSLFWRI